MKKQKNSGLAIASLTTGILSIIFGWIPFFGWLLIGVSILTGGLALGNISKNKNLKGRKMAITGIVLGSISFVFYLILTLFLILFWSTIFLGILTP